MSREKLTSTQQKVYRFLSSYRDKHGWPPTRAEIAKKLGYASPNAAQQHLELIEKKGYIKLSQRLARGIEIL